MAMPDTAARWTLAELHRLPDDGNRYELVRGDLLVTPPPSYRHQRVVEVLASLLQPYVTTNALGTLSFPRSVVRIGGDTEVEPDLMVRPVPKVLPTTWDEAPLPILVVDVASSTTRRGDRTNKRSAYVDAPIAEYWIVDAERRSIRVVRPGREDADVRTSLIWQPAGASEPFTLDVAGLFRTALGEE